MGLLAGLEKLGLGNLEAMELYEQPKAKAENEGAAGEKKAVPTVQEQDLLFDKSYTCPLCDKEFKSKTVKVGKAKLIGTDMDLRPKYEIVDMLKYDVISCPHCGYTALSRFFKFLTAPQAKKVKQIISKSYKSPKIIEMTYSYEVALDRYKLALANAIVKQSKASEKAYICLKTGWLLRGMQEALKDNDPEYDKKKKELLDQENEFIKNAYDGFINARQTENFPMCGMDESTVDYLLAVLAMKFEQYDVATRLVASILASTSANPRMKDKAREVKEMLVKVIREKKQGQK